MRSTKVGMTVSVPAGVWSTALQAGRRLCSRRLASERWRRTHCRSGSEVVADPGYRFVLVLPWCSGIEAERSFQRSDIAIALTTIDSSANVLGKTNVPPGGPTVPAGAAVAIFETPPWVKCLSM